MSLPPAAFAGGSAGIVTVAYPVKSTLLIGTGWPKWDHPPTVQLIRLWAAWLAEYEMNIYQQVIPGTASIRAREGHQFPIHNERTTCSK